MTGNYMMCLPILFYGPNPVLDQPPLTYLQLFSYVGHEIQQVLYITQFLYHKVSFQIKLTTNKLKK